MNKYLTIKHMHKHTDFLGKVYTFALIVHIG